MWNSKFTLFIKYVNEFNYIHMYYPYAHFFEESSLKGGFFFFVFPQLCSRLLVYDFCINDRAFLTAKCITVKLEIIPTFVCRWDFLPIAESPDPSNTLCKLSTTTIPLS